MKYIEAVEKSYETSKFKNEVPKEIYIFLGMLFMTFIRLTMSDKRVKRVRFPGLCEFYLSEKRIKKTIEYMEAREAKPERVAELKVLLTKLNKK